MLQLAFDHARSLHCDVITTKGTLDFVTARDNVVPICAAVRLTGAIVTWLHANLRPSLTTF